MISTEAGTIAGIIGYIISILWFLYLIPKFYSIYKKDPVNDFSPDHYLVTFLNCALWDFYGIVQPNSLLFVTMNGIGLIIEFIYVALYLIYTSKKQILSVGKMSVCALVFYLVVVLRIAPFLNSGRNTAIAYLGYLCVCINLYTIFPYHMLVRVYDTKSVEHISLWASLFSFLNGICWLTYALSYLNDYLYIGYASSHACAFGIVQLMFYANYSFKYQRPQSKNNKIHDKKAAGGEFQLPFLDDMV